MQTQELLTPDSIVLLLKCSDLSFISKQTGIPYATLYNYKCERNRVSAMPYHLWKKLSELAFKLNTVELQRGSPNGEKSTK